VSVAYIAKFQLFLISLVYFRTLFLVFVREKNMSILGSKYRVRTTLQHSFQQFLKMCHLKEVRHCFDY